MSNDNQTENAATSVSSPEAEALVMQDAPAAEFLAAERLDLRKCKLVIETALLSSKEALPVDALVRLFDPPLPSDTVRALTEEVQRDWADRGVELVLVATGYRFQTKTEYQRYLDRLQPEKAPRYSRSIMETLAIIAYRQPTTRGEIEAIRGVAVSSHVIKALEDREWIEVIGHKDSPGRPALYATTKKFLNDLGLRSLSELPALADLDEHPALEVPAVPPEQPFPQQARLDPEQNDGQTMLEMPLVQRDSALARLEETPHASTSAPVTPPENHEEKGNLHGHHHAD